MTMWDNGAMINSVRVNKKVEKIYKRMLSRGRTSKKKCLKNLSRQILCKYLLEWPFFFFSWPKESKQHVWMWGIYHQSHHFTIERKLNSCDTDFLLWRGGNWSSKEWSVYRFSHVKLAYTHIYSYYILTL